MSSIAKMTTEFEEPVDSIDDIPYFEPEFDDPEDIAQHFRTLYDNRHLAYIRPISEDWSFIAKIPSLSLTEPPNARSIPHFARKGGDFCFTVDIGLQQMDEDITKSSYNSQVWVANVTTLEGIGTHPDYAQRESVVLKIVQPSLLPPPDLDRKDWSISPSARQLAFSEDFIYHTLSSCQGIQVPWYFGKFEVQMPNGEQAYVLIMEHIQGDGMDELCNCYKEATENDKKEHLQRLQRIFPSITDTFDPLDEAKVFLNHVPLDNIIIDNDDKAVVIGFANRRVCDNIEALKARVKLNNRSATSQGECVVNSILSVHRMASGSEYGPQFMEWASGVNEVWYTRRLARDRGRERT
ncbi:hypothetical protein BDZ89DRAFT_1161188 [Hymenopellis radicata]|nr:hypothetical protein BDZ89DRAFT_1161188 [Hymenopellis radicata]